MLRLSNLRSDFPLIFMCFQPDHESEASPLVYGFFTDVLCRDTDVCRLLCYSRIRSAQPSGLLNEDVALRVQRRGSTGCVLLPDDDAHRLTDECPFELWLTFSDLLQKHPGMTAAREQSYAESFRTLSLYFDVHRCIPALYLNEVPAEDDNLTVRRCPTRVSRSRMISPVGDVSNCRAQNCTYPDTNTAKERSTSCHTAEDGYVLNRCSQAKRLAFAKRPVSNTL